MPKTILVVDDDQQYRIQLQSWINEMKHVPLTANGAYAGISMSCQNSRIDLVVLELRMSDKDGIETLEYFKENLGYHGNALITASKATELEHQQALELTG